MRAPSEARDVHATSSGAASRPAKIGAIEDKARATLKDASFQTHWGYFVPQQRYAEAYPIATKLTAGLGLRGVRLNLAVEGATSYEDLLALSPKIRDAVGAEKFAPLAKALGKA